MGFNTYPQNPFPPSSETAGGEKYTLPIASTTELGGVKVGSGLAINAETGVLTNNYTLPGDVIRADDIALPFNENSSYLAGDFCYYDGTLYRFEVDHDGAWDASDVLAVRVCDSIISEFGDGLQRVANSVSVKLESGGGLAFNSDGELYTNVVHNYSTTEQPTGQKWIDGKDIYFRVVVTQEAVSMPYNTWVNLGVDIADFAVGIRAVGIGSTGACVPLCMDRDATVGIQLLNMRNTTLSFNTFILEYAKSTS